VVPSLGFLLLGLTAYWFLRPDIPLFDLLRIHNPHPPVVGDAGALVWVRNHLADAAWCAAAFLMAARLREGGWPAFYPGFLLALPFVGEILQGTGWVPGTFDWADLSISILVLGLFAAGKFLSCGNRRSMSRA
jgi:hypothetical protein